MSTVALGLLGTLVLGFVVGLATGLLGSDNMGTEAEWNETVLGGSKPPKGYSEEEMWCLAIMT